jgi:2-C-methyl-D-erythritol 4-phosphate cytidylyltransferase
MGFDKLSAQVGGVSVLGRSLLAFERCPAVEEIRVVTTPERFAEIAETAQALGVSKFVEAVEGGAERHLSVHAGLGRVGEGAELVAVHDAARPLVSPAAIARCAEAASACGAATLARRVADTLKRGNAAGEVVASVSRDDLWAMETPQIFEVGLLREAYAALLAAGGSVTDEVSAVAALGRVVRLVENAEPNLKITVPADLDVAAAILAARGDLAG